MGKGRFSVPDRWEDYTNFGHQIAGTRFIAFKVPLKEEICQNLDDKSLKFSPGDLLQHISEKKIPLGLIVDLTFTERYYNPSIFTENSLDFVKLPTPGGDSILPEHLVQRFIKTVQDYIKKSEKENTLIGVHCTHGVNRTGYLICRYLIDVLKMDHIEAVKEFQTARGHTFDRALYTEDLKIRSNKREKIYNHNISTQIRWADCKQASCSNNATKNIDKNSRHQRVDFKNYGYKQQKGNSYDNYYPSHSSHFHGQSYYPGYYQGQNSFHPSSNYCQESQESWHNQGQNSFNPFTNYCQEPQVSWHNQRQNSFHPTTNYDQELQEPWQIINTPAARRKPRKTRKRL